MAEFIQEYNKYFTSRDFTRLDLFKKIKHKYSLRKALYLGSHIHITPSLVFPDVVYVDTYKKFKDMVEQPTAKEFVEQNKLYDENANVRFIQQSYVNVLDIDKDFDLLISQYAGLVSQAGKKYLKAGGILIANNSHGDASMANLDKDFDLIAVANHKNDDWRISNKNLDKYFVPNNGKPETKQTILESGKGTGYKKSAADYIFRKR